MFGHLSVKFSPPLSYHDYCGLLNFMPIVRTSKLLQSYQYTPCTYDWIFFLLLWEARTRPWKIFECFKTIVVCTTVHWLQYHTNIAYQKKLRIDHRLCSSITQFVAVQGCQGVQIIEEAVKHCTIFMKYLHTWLYFKSVWTDFSVKMKACWPL